METDGIAGLFKYITAALGKMAHTCDLSSVAAEAEKLEESLKYIERPPIS